MMMTMEKNLDQAMVAAAVAAAVAAQVPVAPAVVSASDTTAVIANAHILDIVTAIGNRTALCSPADADPHDQEQSVIGRELELAPETAILEHEDTVQIASEEAL